MSQLALLCQLGPLMKARRVTYKDLNAWGFNNNEICDLVQSQWVVISAEKLRILCEVLRVTPGELLISVWQDLWFCASGKPEDVILHVGQRSVGAVPAFKNEVMYSADVYASNAIRDHLKTCGVAGVRIAGHSISLPAEVTSLLRSGVHVIVGSPIANPLVDPAIRELFDVPPSTADAPVPFPYRMIWSQPLSSSIGHQATGGELGIYSRETEQCLATRRDHVDGSSEDCALIVAKRFPILRNRRFDGDSRVVILIMGHGAAGTHAGALAAIREEVAATLFPTEFGRVVTGVVRVKYQRRAPGSCEPPELAPELVQVAETIVTGDEAGQTRYPEIVGRTKKAPTRTIRTPWGRAKKARSRKAGGRGSRRSKGSAAGG